MLAADIGATTTRFAIVGKKIILRRVVPTSSRFLRELEDFLSVAARRGYPVSSGGFAVAAPVTGRKARLTNNAVVIDARRIERATILQKALLMNDVVAAAVAVARSGVRERLIRRGKQRSVRLVVSVGTGFGAALLLPDGKVLPSEAGHADFPFWSLEERALAAFLRDAEGFHNDARLSVEDVVSGRGLERVYEFLRTTQFQEAPVLDAAGISAARKGSRGKKRSQKEQKEWRAREKSKKECSRLAFSWFARFLGRAVQNLALSFWATGGLFLTGGVVLKNPHLVKPFLASFDDHYCYSDVLSSIRVSLLDEDAPLYGAAAVAEENLAPLTKRL